MGLDLCHYMTKTGKNGLGEKPFTYSDAMNNPYLCGRLLLETYMKKLLFLLPVLAVLFAACEKEENAIEGNGQENSGTSGTPTTSVGEAVDLGLSVKWATFNVGATKPEEYGDYFAWGETKPKETYEWTTYKWCKGSYRTQTKYCTDSYYGTVDNKITLDPEDDAAHVNWGGNWRMPTEAELNELLEKCTWTWITQNGVNGYVVTSSITGKSIFLPAAGERYGSLVYKAGTKGNYWLSSLSILSSNNALAIIFYLDYKDCGEFSRYHGQSVRPVCP